MPVSSSISGTAPVPPPKTREQLIAEERAAEQLVVDAEIAWMRADATNDPSAPDLRAALDEARRVSLAVRDEMTAGLAAWTKYYAMREVEQHAANSPGSRVGRTGKLVG